MAPIALHNYTNLETQKTSKKLRLKHDRTTSLKRQALPKFPTYMKLTTSASHVTVYTMNGTPLMIHGNYMHDIFHIAHTSQIGKPNFSLETFYNRTPTNRLDIQHITDFYNNKYDVSALTYFV